MSVSTVAITQALIAETAIIRGDVSVGHGSSVGAWSIIGHPNHDQDIFTDQETRRVQIGAGVSVGLWALIHEGAVIGDNVQIYDRCTVGSLTRVETGSRLLYGAQVHDGVSIGENCIIAGFIGDNCVIGTGSSVFGSLVHRYDHPGPEKWDVTDEQGPTLGRNVIIGWGAVIVGPISLGDGARVFPNAVLTRNLGEGEVYGGG
ncbi:DapH/DapD/GlmU-related protein [Bradyrhizobium sp. 14AA]